MRIRLRFIIHIVSCGNLVFEMPKFKNLLVMRLKYFGIKAKDMRAEKLLFVDSHYPEGETVEKAGETFGTAVMKLRWNFKELCGNALN